MKQNKYIVDILEPRLEDDMYVLEYQFDDGSWECETYDKLEDAKSRVFELKEVKPLDGYGSQKEDDLRNQYPEQV